MLIWVHARRLLALSCVAAGVVRGGRPRTPGAQPLPEGPSARSTAGSRQRRGRRHDRQPRRGGLVQLHRLRAQRAAHDAARRSRGLASGGKDRVRRGNPLGRPRAALAPMPRTSACGRGAGHNFDIQAGRIPPTFGAFGRHAYGTDNPVIGYPLAYQYLTSLRTDAVPETADDLLRDARARLAIQLPGRLADARPGRPDHHRVPVGYRRAGPVEAGTGRSDRRVDQRHAVEPAGARRQRRQADRRARGRDAGGRLDYRRVCGPRRLAVARESIRRPTLRRRSASSAPTWSTRAITGSCAASWCGAAGVSRSAVAGRTPITSARWARGPKDATASRRASTSRAGPTGSPSRGCAAACRDRRAAVGRPGHAHRGGAGVLPPAQLRAAGDGAGQLARRPAASTTGRSCRRSWRTGSDAYPWPRGPRDGPGRGRVCAAYGRPGRTTAADGSDSPCLRRLTGERHHPRPRRSAAAAADTCRARASPISA